jgi:hypothetical protein
VDLPDPALWQRSRMTDAAEDDAERILDLAGFADGRLDPDDRERVAEWLAGDPRRPAMSRRRARSPRRPQRNRRPSRWSRGPRSSSIAMSSAACHPLSGHPPRPADAASYRELGSFAAAMAVASWLGFTLGMDTSLSFVQRGQPGEDGFFSEMLDTSPGFMRDLSEGNQT